MDLTKLGIVESKTLTIIEPYTEVETDITIELYPFKSKIGNEAQHSLNTKKLQLFQDENNIIEIDGQKRLKDEIVNDLMAEVLADITVGWNNIEKDGKTIKFNKKNAITIYKEFDFIKNQILMFVSDFEGNYLKK